MLFDVDNVKQAARAYRTVSLLAEADRRRIAQFQQTTEDLHRTQATLADRVRRITAVQADAIIARQAAERAVAEHAALISRIDARRDLNAQLVGELQAARQKLAGLAPAQPPVAATRTAKPLPALASMRGSLDWPVAGPVVAPFGSQRDARYGTTTVRAGVDITALPGTPAASVEDGVVAYADPFTGFGNLVIVDHGGQAYSLYGYLESVAVTRGTQVARGQKVGTVGRSPAGKPGLYFELRIDGKAVDPVQWLKKGRPLYQ
jgi:septal ring factor EnvC (AmiA/AmiB activator)